jgi:hypothetical protein
MCAERLFEFIHLTSRIARICAFAFPRSILASDRIDEVKVRDERIASLLKLSNRSDQLTLFSDYYLSLNLRSFALCNEFTAIAKTHLASM